MSDGVSQHRRHGLSSGRRPIQPQRQVGDKATEAGHVLAVQIGQLVLGRMDALEDRRDEALLQAVVLAPVEGQPHLVGADRVLCSQRDHRHAGGREDPVVAGRIDGEGDAVDRLFGALGAQGAQDKARLGAVVLAVHDGAAVCGDVGVDHGVDAALVVALQPGLGADQAQLLLVGQDEDQPVAGRLGTTTRALIKHRSTIDQ